MKKQLGISPITGTVYYGTVGVDKDGLEYWKTKTEVPASEFIPTMLSYIKQKADDKGVMTVTVNGKAKYVIRLEEVVEDRVDDMDDMDGNGQPRSPRLKKRGERQRG